MRQGSILEGRYTVGRVLGQGGFGITYIALDDQTKERVAIKEYLPTDFAGRSEGSSIVRAFSGNRRENFEYGKEQFLSEAKTLAAFIGDSHIVRIYRYFEENGTAYFSMEYVDGLPLNRYMREKGGRLTAEDANRLLLPLMDSLDRVHAKGIVHRDIAPDTSSSSRMEVRS
ncbi:MAG: protein kinase [Oscillospiraceae bacterium]|nr:protein kinase [Oscillospiraceae bacterium]